MPDAAPPPDTIIDIRDLVFSWPGAPKGQAPLLDIGRFSLGRGEKLMLSGPSGSGKSTLLGLITGILTGASGTCLVDGQDMMTLSGQARDRLRADKIGYIFQSFNLVPYLSVIDNVTLPCRLSDARAKAAGNVTARAEELLSRLGLDGKRLQHGKVTALSIGQQQRVAAARALIGSPPLIIADEPTSSLDEDRKNDFLRLMLGEADKAGAAVLFVSHDRTLERHFDRLVHLAYINGTRQANTDPAGEPA